MILLSCRKVSALSNSRQQREYIQKVAASRGIKNLTVYTGDVAVYKNEAFDGNFDRVISVG